MTKNNPNRMTILLSNAVGYFGTFIYVPIFVSYLGREYSASTSGIVILLGMLGRLASSRIAGSLYNRWDRKNLVLIGLLVEAFSLLAMGFASSPLALACLAFFEGIGSSLEYPGLKAFATDVSPKEQSKALSRFQVSGQIGMVLGSLAGVLFATANISLVMLAASTLCFLSTAIVFLFVPKTNQVNANDGRDVIREKTLVSSKSGTALVKSIFIASSMYWFFQNQFVVAVPLHLTSIGSDLSPSLPLLISALFFTLFGGKPYLSLSRKFDSRKIISFAVISAIISSLIFGSFHANSAVVIATLFFVISQSLFEPAFDSYALENFQQNQDIASVHATTLFYRTLGATVGTLCSGILIDFSRDLELVGLNWYIIAIAPAGCFAIMSFAKRTTQLQIRPKVEVAK